MDKKLDEMTLEELWQLFPIFLRPHDPLWSQWYDEERELIAAALPGAMIHHIGSTAVPGIWAKPIVDILVEVDLGSFSDAHSAILACGYRCMCVEPSRRDYNKGYTEAGFAERVFHLHLRVTGDNDELIFRDYLLAHPDVAEEYEALKLALWKEFEHDRDGYTDAKGGFISRHTQAAKGKRKI